MKRFLLTSLVLALGLAVGAAVWWSGARAPLTSAPHPKLIEIPEGASLKWVAAILEGEGVVGSRHVFEWAGRLAQVEDEIRAGRYVVSSSMSVDDILERLVSGEIEPIRIKFVEGIWMSEVIGLLADSLGLDADALDARARDPEFLAHYDIEAPTAEGYLFPDTYLFEGSEDVDGALARLLEAGRAYRGRWQGRADVLSMPWHDILTIASIVEAETGVADEREKVSSVYHRRLRKDMLLQADPTLIYGLGIRGHVLTRTNLNTDGPFNTYKRKGLPPYPIGNPGASAIDAALSPDFERTALYFVAKPGGGHTFSDTYEQHLVAVKRWRNR